MDDSFAGDLYILLIQLSDLIVQSNNDGVSLTSKYSYHSIKNFRIYKQINNYGVYLIFISTMIIR